VTDILETLKSYPDDPTIVMSRRVVNDIIAEIEQLRAELAAEREEVKNLQMAGMHFMAERDELRELLELSRPYVGQADGLLADRIDAALNKGGGG